MGIDSTFLLFIERIFFSYILHLISGKQHRRLLKLFLFFGQTDRWLSLKNFWWFEMGKMLHRSPTTLFLYNGKDSTKWRQENVYASCRSGQSVYYSCLSAKCSLWQDNIRSLHFLSPCSCWITNISFWKWK